MKTMDFIKGLGTGMVAGAAIGMAVAPNKKKYKSVVGKALKTAGDMAESFTNALGL